MDWGDIIVIKVLGFLASLAGDRIMDKASNMGRRCGDERMDEK
jgi:hypothetical protein